MHSHASTPNPQQSRTWWKERHLGNNLNGYERPIQLQLDSIPFPCLGTRSKMSQQRAPFTEGALLFSFSEVYSRGKAGEGENT